MNYIIDLDGTIYRGDTPILYAREFLDYLNHGDRKYLLLTNCPSNTQASLVEKLRKMDIEVSEANILTSGQATASYLVRNNIRAVYLVGGTALDTDILLGNKHGVASYLVLTGVAEESELSMSAVKPTEVFEDLRELMEFDALGVRSGEC